MYLNKFAPVVKGETELDCAGANIDYFGVFSNMRVCRLMAVVSTVMVSTGTIILTFYKRPTRGSTVGEVSIGTVIIPATAAVGGCYYKDLEGIAIQPGQQVVVKVSTAATTSGKVLSGFESNEEAEVPSNLLMIASA